MSTIDHLDRPAAEVAAIEAALAKHGALAVHKAALAAYSGQRAALASMIGDWTTLGTVHAAATAAFAALTPEQQKSDQIEAERDLSSLAQTLGAKGGSVRGGTKAAASRRNGLLGGTTADRFFIDEANLGAVGFILGRHDTNHPKVPTVYTLSEHPGRTNMSSEPRLQAWLGTTNNVYLTSHGVGRVVRVFKNGRGEVRRLDSENTRRWLVEDSGYPNLVDQIAD